MTLHDPTHGAASNVDQLYGVLREVFARLCTSTAGLTDHVGDSPLRVTKLLDALRHFVEGNMNCSWHVAVDVFIGLADVDQKD